MVAPWIMVDELVYSELAKSFASDAGGSLWRDEPINGYGAVYPLLISPAYASSTRSRTRTPPRRRSTRS